MANSKHLSILLHVHFEIGSNYFGDLDLFAKIGEKITPPENNINNPLYGSILASHVSLSPEKYAKKCRCDLIWYVHLCMIDTSSVVSSEPIKYLSIECWCIIMTKCRWFDLHEDNLCSLVYFIYQIHQFVLDEQT